MAAMSDYAEFECLQILRDRIVNDPKNAGWYMYKAFSLGQGSTISEALELPQTKPLMTLVKK